MNHILLVTCLFVFLWANVSSDMEFTTTQRPSPYIFSYTAGRFPGQTDRFHGEVGDGDGNVKGTYSYVDPRHRVRTVDYVANRNGFYPFLSHPYPSDTEAVKRAKNDHLELYSRIAQEHAAYKITEDESRPLDTEAVVNAKQQHLSLYERIAAEHARIAEEARLAAEAETEQPR